jgi:purine-binding chemotaxis protein CheW
MNEAYDIAWNDEDKIEALTFDILDQSFAIEADLVHEIVDPIHETAVPGSEPLVGCVVNFRGRIIPLANLHRTFGLAKTDVGPDSRIVVIELTVQDESCLIGLKVDRVHEVVALSRCAAEAPPHIGLRFDRTLIRCLIKRDDAIIAIPDLSRIFALPPHGRKAFSTH